MTENTLAIHDCWCAEFAWPPAGLPSGLTCWQAVDAPMGRAYAPRDVVQPEPTGWSWQRLHCLVRLDGASAGATAACHYVVQAEVLPEHEAHFNAWYMEEHLPGLAAVPGTIRATRYVHERADGQRRYHACYDLTAADVLGSPPWLAVRGTDWSSRVRPLFLRPTRWMYRRPTR